MRIRLPIVDWMRTYERAWLRFDLVAGLTIVALLVPEGMAYAQIAGVPPQTAFYAAPVGLLLFAALGSNRQLVVAVSSAIASMSFGTVSLMAEPNSERFITLTAALAVLAGLFGIIAGLLRLGRVAQFFSESVMVGFITGLALLIMMKQLSKMLGIEAGSGNFWHRGWDVLRHLGDTHALTLVVALATLALLLVMEHFVERIPAALVALVVGIAVSAALHLEHHGVEIVGPLPSGLAGPRWPSVSMHDWGMLVPGALGIALVAFAEAVGPARAFAIEHRYETDPDQDFLGLGAANLGAGLFQGFSIGSSLSKSAANNRAGAKSQLSAVVAAGVTALVALYCTSVFRQLPEAVLGAIVVVAVSGMVKAAEMRRLAQLRRIDFGIAVATLLAVLTFDTLQALGIAVVISVFVVIWRTSRPRLTVLARVPGRLELSDLRRHPTNQPVPGLLMLRPDNELFFANVAGFREAITAELAASPAGTEAVLIDMSATTEIDVPAADMIDELRALLHASNVRLMLAHTGADVRRLIERASDDAVIPIDDLFLEPIDAVIDHCTRRRDVTTLAELHAAAEHLSDRLQLPLD